MTSGKGTLPAGEQLERGGVSVKPPMTWTDTVRARAVEVPPQNLFATRGPTVEAKSPKTGSWGKYSVGHWDPSSDGRGSRANKNIM